MPQRGTLIQKSHRWIPSTKCIQSRSRTVTYQRNVLSKTATNDWPYAGTNSDGNNQLVSYDYVVLYRNITNLIIITPADYVT